jgi:hemolysin III
MSRGGRLGEVDARMSAAVDPAELGRAARGGDLYDSVRGIYYRKPVLRGWLHLVWFEAALVLGTLLILNAQGSREVTAASIYAAGVAGLFGASALYHRGNWGPAWNARLQRVDHTMIFVVIAATATPAYLLAARGTFSVVGLTAMWAATFAAVGLRMAWMDAPERLVACALVVVSAVAGMAVPAVWIHAGTAPAILLIGAGVLHVIGAISYQLRRPDPVPAVFGYHEVFHTYVCIATACQYTAIGLFIL